MSAMAEVDDDSHREALPTLTRFRDWLGSATKRSVAWLYNLAVRVWGSLSSKELALVVGLLVYAALVVSFLLIWQSSFLNYLVILAGMALAALIPAIASGRKVLLLVLLVIALAAVTAWVEWADGLERKRAIAQLLSQLQALSLNQAKERELRVKEAHLREQVRLDPLDTLDAIRHSHKGFLKKAERLSLRAAWKEVELLAASPAVVDRLLTFSSNPQIKLSSFRAAREELAADASEPVRLMELLDDVIASLEDEVAYRKLATLFEEDVKPVYEGLLSDAQATPTSSEKLREKLRAFLDDLPSGLANYELAGWLNHLGNVAMASQRPERALGYFFEGISADPEHVPLYESIAYVSWAVNRDAGTALRYASKGLAQSDAIEKAVKTEFDRIRHVHRAIALTRPELKELIEKRMEMMQSRFQQIQSVTGPQLEGLRARLRLSFAYFSALELANEVKAREYATLLYEADPEDGEYQDTLGFVLMRFALTPDELEKAERLFSEAIDNSRSERMTRRLANLHLQELSRRRRELGLSD